MDALLFVVALTLGVSALCSLFEATLYSTRVVTLEAARDQRRHEASARQFLRWKRNIAIPTSAILILNTVANTAGATFAGMLASDALGPANIPIFSGLLTLGILLFSEILPKTYGATHWQRLWPGVVWPLLALEKLLLPLIWITRWFSELFVPKSSSSGTTEDEIVAMIRMGARAGELSETELQLLTAVFRFDDALVQDVMFPRRDVAFFDVSWDLAHCREVAMRTQHTRYPLCDGTLDHLLGCIHVKDLLGRIDDPSADVRALARPMRRVPDTMPVRRLLREMQRTQAHMVAVVDEHGTVVGLATLENLLEQLVGAVQDEFDREAPEIVPVADGTYVVRGGVPVSRLNGELQLQLSDDEASTLSGLVVNELGRLPVPGDCVDLGRIQAEVLEVEGHRAARLRLQIAAASAQGDA